VNLHALPRVPLPPLRERPLPISQEHFDEYYFGGETNDQLTISGLGLLDESWSGYALNRTGESVIPFTIPALNSSRESFQRYGGCGGLVPQCRASYQRHRGRLGRHELRLNEYPFQRDKCGRRSSRW